MFSILLTSDRPVVIVGGGVAGLTVGLRLQQAGTAFRLLEARPRLGGRVLSTDETGLISHDGFDLGPSWFWPEMQPAFSRLVEALGLTSFTQYDKGDVLLQPMPPGPPQRRRSLNHTPSSTRLIGGTASIVAALEGALPKGSVELGACVTDARINNEGVELAYLDAAGTARTCRSPLVVFALPPRLLQSTISFAPAVDEASARRWRDTPTWMAPHAKFFAIYDEPFWRSHGLSGTAHSMVGPLAEIHDATTASGKAALFGFLGMPAQHRSSVGEQAIVAACVAQLTSLFGSEAERPRATLFKDWAVDPFTSTDMDRIAIGHPMVDRHPWVGKEWRDRILLAGSETSDHAPGYLAGAVDAAERTAATVIARGRTLPLGDYLSQMGN